MSLVITSSNQPDLYETIEDNSAEKPYAYRNHFTQPIRVKPFSEIALQSLKVNRQPAIQVAENDLFAFFFGDTLKFVDKPLTSTTSFPILIPMSAHKNINLNSSSSPELSSLDPLSITQFAERMQHMLNHYVGHPELRGQFVVDVKQDAGSGLPLGFEITTKQLGNASNIYNNPTQFYAVNEDTYLLNGNGSYVSVGGSFTLEKKVLGGIGTGRFIADKPISLAEGVFRFSVSNCSSVWSVGLSRPLRAYGYLKQIGQSNLFSDNTIDPRYFNPESSEVNGLFDGVGSFSDVTIRRTPDKKIYIEHSVPIIADGIMEEQGMESIDYWTYTAGISAPLDLAGSASNIDKFEIRVQNEDVQIWAIDSVKSANNFELISRHNISASGGNCVKPLNQNCWDLHAKIEIAEPNQKIEVNQYSGRSYGGDGLTNEIGYWNTSWWGMCNSFFSDLIYGLAGRRWTYELDFRGNQIPNASGNDNILGNGINFASHQIRKMNADVVGGGGVNSAPTFIFGKDDLYLPNVLDNFQPNMSRRMGFDGLVRINSSNVLASGSNNLIKIKSCQKPKLSGLASYFVRLSQLGHTTYNGAKQSESKIIGTIPSFDNRGADTGALYFEPSERVYIDLNNPQQINLNELNVDIVDKNEQFATGLSGNTIAMFHIREKKKHK